MADLHVSCIVHMLISQCVKLLYCCSTQVSKILSTVFERQPACSSYVHVIHCAFVITCILGYDASTKHFECNASYCLFDSTFMYGLSYFTDLAQDEHQYKLYTAMVGSGLNYKPIAICVIHTFIVHLWFCLHVTIQEIPVSMQLQISYGKKELKSICLYPEHYVSNHKWHLQQRFCTLFNKIPWSCHKYQ